MKPRTAPKPIPPVPSRGAIVCVGALVVLATVAAYANSLSGPFVFDDTESIVGNPTIRSLATALAPPHGGLTVCGRPLLNLSLAINYAISGEGVWSYHVLNVAIHVLSALLLFGIVRRTLVSMAKVPDAGPAADATMVAGLAALLWAVHPLQTGAVTYVIQRAESLMGLFLFLTLYAFIRSSAATHPSGWRFVSLAACVAGMATKEVMVGAPLLVLLYDRTFVARTFTAAWTRRRSYYAGLAASWVVLALLVADAGGNRGGSVGFGVGTPWFAYGLTQFEALTRYAGLAVWPHPLVFEYGKFFVTRPGEVLPFVAPVLLLVGGTAYALWRRPALGYLGAWILVILAPTSLLPGTTQMIVEYRMYLPLAAVAVLVAVLVRRWAGRKGMVGLLLAACILGLLTVRRNEAYGSAAALWGDTVAKRPANARAHFNLAQALAHEGRADEAVAEYGRALQIDPDDAETRNNLGAALVQAGRITDAIREFHEALRLRPAYAAAHNNLGNTLAEYGEMADAAAEFSEAVRLDPGHAKARANLGNAYAQMGRMDAAVAQFEEALRLEPGDLAARYSLACALAQLGRREDAVVQLQALLQRSPGDGRARQALEQLQPRRPEESD